MITPQVEERADDIHSFCTLDDRACVGGGDTGRAFPDVFRFCKEFPVELV